MEEAIYTTTELGYTLNIIVDDCPESPRVWDNLGKLFIPRPPRSLNMSEGTKEECAAAAIKIPVYILDHSGVVISTTPFGCPWDSWHAGYYYVTREAVIAEYGNLSPESLKTAEKCAAAELQAYAAYVSGETYAFTIERRNKELLDSCSGYYGRSGIQAIQQNFQEEVKRLYKKDFPLFEYAGIA